ncbi:MAG: hypothetical protein Q4P71_01240 [Actinomycetaceae bacterium]|nr:hypothetical protein [Actinomycetaceae bacterium]
MTTTGKTVLYASATALALILAGCSSGGEPPTGNPNSDLPTVEAPSTGCDAMNSVLEKEFRTSASGQEFIEAQASEDAGDDLAKSEERSKRVETAWIAFLEDLEQEGRKQEFEKAAGDDSRAREALTALATYTEVSKTLSSGEVAQFDDPEAAELAVKEGRDPEENPEFVELTTKLMESHRVLSECMPNWPVTF